MAGRQLHAEFAERLRLALDEAGFRGWSRKKLGAQFGVTPQAFSKWMSGDAIPTPRHAQHLAHIVGVRRAWLLDGEEPMRACQADLAERSQGYSAQSDVLSLSSDEFRLLSRYRQLPRGVQQSLLGLVSELTGPGAGD